MLYSDLAALVPLSILQYAMIVSAQFTFSAAPSPTSAWTQTPSCIVSSDFGPYGAASGIVGDLDVYSFSTGVIPGLPNDGGPSVCFEPDDPLFYFSSLLSFSQIYRLLTFLSLSSLVS